MVKLDTQNFSCSKVRIVLYGFSSLYIHEASCMKGESVGLKKCVQEFKFVDLEFSKMTIGAIES